MPYDVIVVGGSYGGMSAALQLARARRTVLVIDAGLRRNRFSRASHGFLTQDGASPDAVAQQARSQLLRYPTVAWRQGTAAAASASEGGFEVRLESGERVDARRLVLATGVVDMLPPLPGLAERWGRTAHLCPYCDGYEADLGPLGVLATSEAWFHQAMLIPEWGRTTVFTNGIVRPDGQQRAQLEARGVAIEEVPVDAVTGEHATMALRDGRNIELNGLFLMPPNRPGSPIASELGCVIEHGVTSAFLRTDAHKETTVKGVFACGDAARAAASVSLAIGDGASAGIGVHQSLVFG